MLVRKRYYIWLIKAYVKRWGKTILTSLVIGILISVTTLLAVNFYIRPILEKKVTRIGISGAYRVEEMPDIILKDVSMGLTQVDKTGEIKPAAAQSWEIKNNGKEYVFYLKKGLFFHSGKELTADTVPFEFSDVKKKKINDYTVSFSLATEYTPFLATVSKPMLDKDLSGLGEFEISKLELNATYLKSFMLVSRKDKTFKKQIFFYPNKDSLIAAYALGEVDLAEKLPSVTNENNIEFSKWKNTKVKKEVNFDEMIVLFYNTTDSQLSNKKLRQALNYALPESMDKFGQRTFSPYPPQSVYFSTPPNFGITGIEIAKQLLTTAEVEEGLTLTIVTRDDFLETANEIKRFWEKLGMKIEIKTVNGRPDNFQIFLSQIKIPKDPDQYTLWHSDQRNNITRFKSLRIDKLLEDGRVTLDLDTRKNIYADFQKYILDEVPASYLYFPYTYSIQRI